MRHAKFAHGYFNFHSRVINITEYFDDFSNGLGIPCRLFSQLDADHLACLGLTGRTGQNNILADALVFRGNYPHAVLIQKTTDDMRIGALQHFNNAAFQTATLIGSDDTNQHTITVQYTLHFAF